MAFLFCLERPVLEVEDKRTFSEICEETQALIAELQEGIKEMIKLNKERVEILDNALEYLDKKEGL